jgi:hypothetical protein
MAETARRSKQPNEAGIVLALFIKRHTLGENESA